MTNRQDIKQSVQFLLAAHGKQLIDFTDVPLLRRVIIAHIQHQCLEQIEFGVVPEVVAPLTAGVLDDHITKQLGHQLFPFDLRQAVPGVRGRWRYQIEYADGVALAAQVLAGFFV